MGEHEELGLLLGGKLDEIAAGTAFAEGGALVDLELVAGEVVGTQRRGLLEVVAQGLDASARQTEDQVDRYRSKAGCQGELGRAPCRRAVVAAAEEAQLVVVEGLNAEGQNVDAKPSPGLEARLVDVFRVGLEVEPRSGIGAERPTDRVEQARQVFGLEQRRRAAAEIDGVDRREWLGDRLAAGDLE